MEVVKLDKQAEVTKDEMIMQNRIDAENRLHSSQLEYESYKRERVLPKLESINEAIIEHQMQYATYINAILNKGILRGDFESRRVVLDGVIIENKDKILFYLPKELRSILNRLRVIVSVSWKEPITLNNTFKSYAGINAVEVCEACQSIYINHVECFFELVEEYIKISSNEKKYKVILEKHGFDGNANYYPKNIFEEIALTYILLHEFKGGEDFVELDRKIEDYVRRKSSN